MYVTAPDIDNRLIVDEERKEATLTYRSGDNNREEQHSVLCNLAMWLRFSGWLIDQYIDVISATCAGPRPKFMAGIRHFFPCPVAYGEAVNSVTFSARHLDAELVRDEEDLTQFLKLAPYYMVIEPRSSTHSITHRIRDILGDDFRQEMPSFEELTTCLICQPARCAGAWRKRVRPTSASRITPGATWPSRC